jgi:protein-L-isoaspartate(D-aspartate) O-methyltransferase
MDFVRARENMIKQQLRTWEVLDGQVLQVIGSVPREDFVPEGFRELAYADHEIPLAHDQVMMAPKVEARLLQAVDIQPLDTVLEIGTGSGYLTALLARRARHVFSVDIFSDFTDAAGERLSGHGVVNVTLETGDAARGWSRHAPYDVIVVTGSLPVVDQAIPSSLKPGGRLFVIAGQSPVMEAMLITRVGESEWIREALFETDLPALLNAPEPSRFVL